MPIIDDRLTAIKGSPQAYRPPATNTARVVTPVRPPVAAPAPVPAYAPQAYQAGPQYKAATYAQGAAYKPATYAQGVAYAPSTYAPAPAYTPGAYAPGPAYQAGTYSPAAIAAPTPLTTDQGWTGPQAAIAMPATQVPTITSGGRPDYAFAGGGAIGGGVGEIAQQDWGMNAAASAQNALLQDAIRRNVAQSQEQEAARGMYRSGIALAVGSERDRMGQLDAANLFAQAAAEQGRLNQGAAIASAGNQLSREQANQQALLSTDATRSGYDVNLRAQALDASQANAANNLAYLGFDEGRRQFNVTDAREQTIADRAYQMERLGYNQKDAQYYAGLNMDDRQFAATFGEQSKQFGANLNQDERQFGATFGEGSRQFGANLSQADRQYGAGLNEDSRQFGAGLSQADRQFGATFGEDSRQYGFGQSQQDRQFGATFGEDSRQFGFGQAQDDRQFGAGLTQADRQYGTTFGQNASQFAATQGLSREQMQLDAQLKALELGGSGAGGNTVAQQFVKDLPDISRFVTESAASGPANGNAIVQQLLSAYPGIDLSQYPQLMLLINRASRDAGTSGALYSQTSLNGPVAGL